MRSAKEAKEVDSDLEKLFKKEVRKEEGELRKEEEKDILKGQKEMLQEEGKEVTLDEKVLVEEEEQEGLKAGSKKVLKEEHQDIRKEVKNLAKEEAALEKAERADLDARRRRDTRQMLKDLEDDEKAKLKKLAPKFNNTKPAADASQKFDVTYPTMSELLVPRARSALKLGALAVSTVAGLLAIGSLRLQSRRGAVGATFSLLATEDLDPEYARGRTDCDWSDGEDYSRSPLLHRLP